MDHQLENEIYIYRAALAEQDRRKRERILNAVRKSCDLTCDF
jgi:hypothetical protein